MSPTPGSRFGPYEILSLLGVGGMGEVYRARDTRLKRDVALKFLSEPFAGDAERLARFQREAELLATLSHPNIATIYGLEDARESGDAATALVMELVEGPTLDEHLKANGDQQQKLLLKEIVDIALQIAEALESAHDRGVIHRDLKPANIKLTASGQVKVLDFGLAKLAEPAGLGSGPAGLTHSPTLSMQATLAGMILGTAAYMSPEQARGKTVDKRTDIWAFGCVLFEMLAGKRAFDGEDVTDAIASVVAREPDWAALPPDLPSQLRLLLRRCLEKDPRKRIGDISTARFLMTETIAPAAASAAPADPTASSINQAKARRRALVFTSAGLAAGAVVAAAATWLTMRTPVESPRPVRFPIVPSAGMPLAMNGADRDIAISPDGSHLVYRGGRDIAQLVVRAFDQLDGQTLAGISGIRSPFISPDGHWIGFFSGPNDELRKVSMTGGPPLMLCRYTGVTRGASWGPDGTIVFATNDTSTGLLSVPEGGGEPKVLTKPDAAAQEIDHLFPSFLPGGKAVLFTITSGGTAQTAQIAALDLKTGQRKILLRGGSSAEYVETGHLVYASGGTLRAVRFDPVRLEVLSDPVPVTEQVMTSGTGAANFAVSRNGTLVYVPGTAGPVLLGAGALRSLAWMSRQGREEPLKMPIRGYTVPRLSPDGTRLALDIRDQENDIWIWEFARATLTRLTFNPSVDIFPVWVPPNGQRIVFSSARSGLMSLYWRAADGTGADEPLVPNRNVTLPGSFSPDGKTLALVDVVPGKGGDIALLQMDEAAGKRRLEPLISTTFAELGPEISPNGQWIAYYSNESGQDEVYVRPFPKIDGGRWQISTGGGTRPAWAKNGRELFYLAGNAMMAVPIQTTPDFRAGNPIKLFEGQFYTGQNTRTYDVSADGQRFLMIKTAIATSTELGAPPTMVVVEHWLEEVKARVPLR
jgi:eukaryotic-like serine/threonine-protein kinase